jgi:hypothetical protein
VLLPVAAMPLACQSSSLVRSRLRVSTHIGTAMPSSRVCTALRTVHAAPCPPVLNPQRPLTTNPPSVRTAMPVGEKTPLMRGSPEAKTSSCTSSGNVDTSHDIALKIVLTHDADGQPRASSASTWHCVRKSASYPPNRFGAVIRNTFGVAQGVEGVGRQTPRLLGGRRALAQHGNQGGGAFDQAEVGIGGKDHGGLGLSAHCPPRTPPGQPFHRQEVKELARVGVLLPQGVPSSAAARNVAPGSGTSEAVPRAAECHAAGGRRLRSASPSVFWPRSAGRRHLLRAPTLASIVTTGA